MDYRLGELNLGGNFGHVAGSGHRVVGGLGGLRVDVTEVGLQLLHRLIHAGRASEAMRGSIRDTISSILSNDN